MALRGDNVEFFEIYRKFAGDQLTVLKLCHNECNGLSFICDRRSDLSGVHFRIGVAKQSTLTESNGVSHEE